MSVHRSDGAKGTHGQYTVVELNSRCVLEEVPPQRLQGEHVLQRHPLVAHLGEGVIGTS